MRIRRINLGDRPPGCPDFVNADEATLGLVPNPKWWVRWPALPLKNINLPWQESAGYIFALDYEDTLEPPYMVYKGNVFPLPQPDTDPIVGNYASLEALMLAGWRVD
jgi:hypothetical protein